LSLTKEMLFELLVGRQRLIGFLEKKEPEQVKKQAFNNQGNDNLFPEFVA